MIKLTINNTLLLAKVLTIALEGYSRYSRLGILEVTSLIRSGTYRIAAYRFTTLALIRRD